MNTTPRHTAVSDHGFFLIDPVEVEGGIQRDFSCNSNHVSPDKKIEILEYERKIVCLQQESEYKTLELELLTLQLKQNATDNRLKSVLDSQHVSRVEESSSGKYLADKREARFLRNKADEKYETTASRHRLRRD